MTRAHYSCRGCSALWSQSSLSFSPKSSLKSSSPPPLPTWFEKVQCKQKMLQGHQVADSASLQRKICKQCHSVKDLQGVPLLQSLLNVLFCKTYKTCSAIQMHCTASQAWGWAWASLSFHFHCPAQLLQRLHHDSFPTSLPELQHRLKWSLRLNFLVHFSMRTLLSFSQSNQKGTEGGLLSFHLPCPAKLLQRLHHDNFSSTALKHKLKCFGDKLLCTFFIEDFTLWVAELSLSLPIPAFAKVTLW